MTRVPNPPYELLPVVPDDDHLVMTPGRLAPMPNQPKTPIKSFRIPDELYRAAQQVAAARGESLSDVVRTALDRYVKRHR